MIRSPKHPDTQAPRPPAPRHHNRYSPTPQRRREFLTRHDNPKNAALIQHPGQNINTADLQSYEYARQAANPTTAPAYIKPQIRKTPPHKSMRGRLSYEL